MVIDRSTLVFFDASCLIAAAGSPNGGSGFLLAVCARGFLKAGVSQPVLLEAERNVVDNLGGAAVGRYYRLVATTPLDLIPVPDLATIHQAETIAGSKDAHVLAAAQASSAPYLLTLDKGLARRINQANLSLVALSPGEFITTLLPQHCDYSSIR